MVLIRDERCKRLQWPMGIVQESRSPGALSSGEGVEGRGVGV